MLAVALSASGGTNAQESPSRRTDFGALQSINSVEAYFGARG